MSKIVKSVKPEGMPRIEICDIFEHGGACDRWWNNLPEGVVAAVEKELQRQEARLEQKYPVAFECSSEKRLEEHIALAKELFAGSQSNLQPIDAVQRAFRFNDYCYALRQAFKEAMVLTQLLHV